MTKGRAALVALAARCAMAAALATSACNPSVKITEDAPKPSSVGPGVATAATSDAPAVADAEARAGVRVVMAAQDADALSLVRTERLRARAEGRVLVVYAGAGWCEPCRRFKRAVESRSLDASLPVTTLLVFDADRDKERLAAGGYSFEYIPYVALPGPDGHPADAMAAHGKGDESWRELLGKLAAWQQIGH